MKDRARRYATFLGLAVAVTAGLCAIGFFPARHLTGRAGVLAMAAGSGIGFLSAALAGALLIAVSAETPETRMQRSFLGMAVRLAVVVVIGAAAVFSGAFPGRPLVFWIGTAYVALLPLEVRLSIL